MRLSRLLAWCLPMVMLLLTVAPAIAQERVDDAPPSSTWIAIVIALGLILAVGIGTFKSPNRTHQD